MASRIKWSVVEKQIASLDQPALLHLIKELFEASQDNRAFFATRFLDVDAQAGILEPYRKRIVHEFFPARGLANWDCAKRAKRSAIIGGPRKIRSARSI